MPRAADSKAATSPKGWSQNVTKNSKALDLERGVSALQPAGITLSLKRSTDTSKRRKGSPLRSANVDAQHLHQSGRQGVVR
jgi:hypothetical protein